MVNIRRTLSDAVAEGVLPAVTAARLQSIAKELPYRERGYGKMLRLAGDLDLPAEELAAFRAWLPEGRFDQKRDDARQMLRTMRRFIVQGTPAGEARFHFERTTLWERAARLA
jgi:hypothetical protein